MINQDFFFALEELERNKGISQEEFVTALENAMSIANKKAAGTPGEVRIKLNPERKTIQFYAERTVVEQLMDLLQSSRSQFLDRVESYLL